MGTVVIVTDVTGGLGSEIAGRFGSAGSKVVENGRAQTTAEGLVREINKGSGEAFAYLVST